MRPRRCSDRWSGSCRTCCNPRMVPDAGDPLFSAWRIARLAHQLATDPRHLFDGNQFYPLPLTLTYSDATFLQGLLGAPFILAGADPLVVANALTLLAFPGLRPRLLLRGVAVDRRSATRRSSPRLLGAWYPFHAEHYTHLELQWVMFVPLAIVAGAADAGGPALDDRPGVRRGRRRAVARVDVPRRDAAVVPRAVHRWSSRSAGACARRGSSPSRSPRPRRSSLPAVRRPRPALSEEPRRPAANAAGRKCPTAARSPSDYGHAHIRLVTYQWQCGAGPSRRARAVSGDVDAGAGRPRHGAAAHGRRHRDASSPGR